MESIDLDILSFLKERENWEVHKDHIEKSLCTKESWLLVGDIGRYYEDNPEETELTKDFKLWMRVTGHPSWKPEEHQLYGKIIDNVLENESPKRGPFLAQLERVRFTQQVAQSFRKFKEGDQDCASFVSDITNAVPNSTTNDSNAVEEYDLESIAQHQRDNKGFYWRLEDVNQSVGPIRLGDFTVVAKRPEVGGTSFLASELSYMVEQMDKDGRAIIFTNEEEPTKIYTRMMGAALNIDYRTMMTAPALYKQKYEAWLDGREWELKHDTSMTLSSIKQKLGSRKYDLIAINVLLKVGGTGAKEDHDKFQALGEHCRRIAQEHGPVVAIVQADPSAEGLRYIPQDRIYKSKTALQGEADVLIFIGHDDNGDPESRYIHVAKNKIPPAPCCQLALKHIKSEARFDIGTGRFISRNWTGNSREGNVKDVGHNN
jgi:replicative DNA helicase